MAECALVHTTERCIIPAVREAYIQPFTAANWLDLRVGFFLSVTDKTNDELTTGLGENLSTTPDGLRSSERYWIGLKTNGTALPRTRNVVFMGYTNSMHSNDFNSDGAETIGNSVLYDSTTVWVPINSINSLWCAMISDGVTMRSHQSQAGSLFTFAQDAATVAAGYATLLAIRLTRPNLGANAKRITMSIKRETAPGGTGEILLSNSPTTELIESNLVDFPLITASMGPIEVGAVPDALYFYWPFLNSRLRIHAIGVYKAR